MWIGFQLKVLRCFDTFLSRVEFVGKQRAPLLHRLSLPSFKVRSLDRLQVLRDLILVPNLFHRHLLDRLLACGSASPASKR